MARMALIDQTSNAAIVTCSNFAFSNVVGEEDPELVSCEIQIKFNGRLGESGDRIAFARNATLAQKQAAVRTKVNEILVAAEPGAVALNNANIQISGLPI